MRYIAVIADVVASRNITDRAHVQEQLVEVLSLLNGANPQLVSPYTVTLGDEFQAVLSGADELFYDAIAILGALHPHRVRFAYGVGDIITPLNTKQAIGMDGPAFHLARDGIEALKETGALFSVCGSMDKVWASLVNAALAFVSHRASDWPKSRYQVLAGLHKGRSVRDLADSLDLTTQAVYKTIDRGALGPLISMFDATAQALNRCLEVEPPPCSPTS